MMFLELNLFSRSFIQNFDALMNLGFISNVIAGNQDENPKQNNFCWIQKNIDRQNSLKIN